MLNEVDLNQFERLFPHLPLAADFYWRHQMAKTLHDLRGTLTESGLDCAAVAAAPDCPEAARWRDLKKLETAYCKSLGEQLDLHNAKREAAIEPKLREGINRVILMGVPDLPLLVQHALEKLVKDGVRVEVVTFGPDESEGLFDEWGRPQPEQWAQRELPLIDGQLIPRLDEAAQAMEVAVRLKAYPKDRARHVAVGVADPGVTPRLERILAEGEVACFNPDGRSLRCAPLVAFLKGLQAVLKQPSFANADALLRMPDAWGWADSVLENFSATRLQKGLDEIREKHLPSKLGDAVRLYFEGEHISNRIHARDVLEQLEKTLSQIEKNPLSDGLVNFLQSAFGKRKFTEGREEDAADL